MAVVRDGVTHPSPGPEFELHGGDTMVVDEPDLEAARDAVRAAGVDVSATGAASYAGVLAARQRGYLAADSRPLVLLTGRNRAMPGRPAP